VSNDDRRSIPGDPIKSLLNNLFGCRVQRAGRLIEKEYLWVRDNTSRDCNSLLLATTEPTRPFPNLGKISLHGVVNTANEGIKLAYLWQLLDEVISIARPACFLNQFHFLFIT